MELNLLTTAVITVLSPYLNKAGEKMAENISQDFYKKLKSWFIEEDQEAAPKANAGADGSNVPVSVDANALEVTVKNRLQHDPALRQSVEVELGITPVNSFILETILTTAQTLRDDLKNLYEDYSMAGIAIQGDIRIQINMKERRLKELEKKFFDTLNPVQ